MTTVDNLGTRASASTADAISRVSFKVRVALIILSFLGLLATITFAEVYRLGQTTR